MATTTVKERTVEPIETAMMLLGGVSRSTIYRLAARGELTIVKIGARSMITVESIKRLAAGTPA